MPARMGRPRGLINQGTAGPSARTKVLARDDNNYELEPRYSNGATGVKMIEDFNEKPSRKATFAFTSTKRC